MDATLNRINNTRTPKKPWAYELKGMVHFLGIQIP